MKSIKGANGGKITNDGGGEKINGSYISEQILHPSTLRSDDFAGVGEEITGNTPPHKL